MTGKPGRSHVLDSLALPKSNGQTVELVTGETAMSGAKRRLDIEFELFAMSIGKLQLPVQTCRRPDSGSKYGSDEKRPAEDGELLRSRGNLAQFFQSEIVRQEAVKEDKPLGFGRDALNRFHSTFDFRNSIAAKESEFNERREARF
jgi:hypothetical protein